MFFCVMGSFALEKSRVGCWLSRYRFGTEVCAGGVFEVIVTFR